MMVFLFMYVTYILYSEKVSKFYVGHTNNINERLRRHNSGETVSIKFGIPWIIVWKENHDSRSEAMKKEKMIKGRGAKRFLEEID